MSGEATTSTTHTVEQDTGAQKESLQTSSEESAVEAQADVEHSEYVTAESSCYATADDTSDEACVSTQPQSSLQDGIANSGANMQDTQENLSAGSGSSIELLEGDASGSGTIMESQQGGETGSGTTMESRQSDETGSGIVVKSQQGGLPGDAKFQQGIRIAMKFPSFVSDLDRQYSRFPNSSPDSSSSGNSQETAVIRDSSSRASLESGVVGDVSYSPDLQENIASGGCSTVRLKVTAAVRDANRQVVNRSRATSLESGAAGDVSYSPDSQESPANGTASWEGMAAPAHFNAGATPSGQMPTRDEREQVIEDLMSGYNQCFDKCACMCDYLRPFSRWIRKSKIFVGIRICLAMMGIIAFILGLSNLSHCPVKHELPILMMLLGIAGIFLTSISLCKSFYCPNYSRWYFIAAIVTARLIFLGIFGAVLNATYTISPSFDREDHENYCNREFYYFAYYTNFVIVGSVVLAFFVYAPSVNESINEYEQL